MIKIPTNEEITIDGLQSELSMRNRKIEMIKEIVEEAKTLIENLSSVSQHIISILEEVKEL